MKKKGIIVIIIIALLACLIGVGAYKVLHSPEYALYQIAKDCKEEGLDGLSRHTTGDAKKIVDTVKGVYESGLTSFVEWLSGESVEALLDENTKDIEWSLDEIIKGDKTTIVRLKFDKSEKLSGTVEVTLELVDKQWMISKISNLKFDKE